MKIHHIGYLVKNIEKAKSNFIDLGFKIDKDIIQDDYRQIYICFLVKDGYLVELVSPVSKESIVYLLLKKISNSPYHICYESKNYNSDIERLQKNGYMICSESHEAVAINGRKVCFLINSNIGMIEILEVK